MKVYLRNKNDKICGEELRFAARFIYAHLVSDHIFERTKLTIESIPMKNTCHGYTIVETSEILKRHPKKFRIQINSKLGHKKQLLTLAHELVHAKQFTKNELGTTTNKNNQRLTKWQGKLVNESVQSYFDLPWEIEAHGREYGLWKRYNNFCCSVRRQRKWKA